MSSISFHRRLDDMRARAIRESSYRPVYAHALTVAHMQHRLIATDDPGWERIAAAIAAVQDGDIQALDTIRRELARMLKTPGT